MAQKTRRWKSKIAKRLSALARGGLFALAVCICASHASAGTIRSIKGERALINFAEGENLLPGDTVYCYFDNGTRKGELVVIATRPGQAVGEMRSGEPEEGDVVKLPPKRAARRPPTPSIGHDDDFKPDSADPRDATRDIERPIDKLPERPPERITERRPRRKAKDRYAWFHSSFFNITGGIATQTEQVKLGNASPIPLSGTGAFGRVSLSGRFPGLQAWEWDFGIAGDVLSAAGSVSTGACGVSNSCTFNLTGVVPSFRVGYVLLPQFYDLEARFGGDVFVPVSATSNVIDVAPGVPLLFVTMGVSIKMDLGSDAYIPLGAEVATYFGGNNVALYRYMVTTGYSWR